MVAVLSQQRLEQPQAVETEVGKHAPGTQVAEPLRLSSDKSFGVEGQIGSHHALLLQSMNPWFGASTFHGTDIARAHADAGTRVLRLACRKSAIVATSRSVIGVSSTVISGTSRELCQMMLRRAQA